MPKQSRSQTIGHEGERWFAAQLPAAWIPQHPTSDVGVDALVVICEEGPLNGLEFRVQVKSAERWRIVDGCILLKGIRRKAVIDLLYSFTPALLVLYETSSKSGYCFWLNQLIAREPELLSSKHESLTLKVPTLRPIVPSLWRELGNEVRGIAGALGRRIVFSGLSLPILEATHSLMQSLHLIDLCANGEGGNMPEDQLIDAEVTAHKEIVTTLFVLDTQLRDLGSPILGVRKTAERYVEMCKAFVPRFEDYVKQTAGGFEYQVSPTELESHRPEAIRAVTQIVGKLTMLSLQGARAASEEAANQRVQRTASAAR